MSKALITESYLTDIANAIRAKNLSSDRYTPAQMAAAIAALPEGGITPTGTLSITQNGTHDVTQYASAVVNVAGGGDDTAFVGTGAPSANLGSDGDYYYQRAQYEYGFTTDPVNNSSARQAGYEFTLNHSISVVGLRGYVRGYTYAQLYLAESNGNPIKQLVNLDFIPGWNYAFFDAPVTLTTGYNYIVQCDAVESNMLMYQSKSNTIFNPNITGVRGRYGGLPGTQDSNAIYSADILIAGDGLYHVIKEYYKSSGAWEVIV